MSLEVYDRNGLKKSPQTRLVGDAPVGSIMPYAGTVIPSDWLACDGSVIARLAYPDLFNAIGTTWGVGDGSTTFNLPDLRGRALIGVGTGANNGATGTGKPSGGSAGTARALAGYGGIEKHPMVIGEMPSHSHRSDAAGGAGGITGNDSPDHAHLPGTGGWSFMVRNPAIGADAAAGGAYGAMHAMDAQTSGRTTVHQHSISVNGSGTAHENMPPWTAVTYIIRAIPPYKSANMTLPPQRRVTSLPGTPYDGQEVYYVADATNGILWHLRYDTTSAKWEVISGPPLRAKVLGPSAINPNGYAAAAGPAITLPLAGDYVAIAEGRYQRSGSPDSVYANMRIAIGSTEQDGSAVSSPTYGQTPTGIWQLHAEAAFTATVNAIVEHQSNTGGSNFNAYHRYLTIRPVRIG